MITIQEWKAMSGKEQTLWLEASHPASKISLAKRKVVHDVAINDAKYPTKIMIEGKLAVCPAYRAWKNMLERAYSAKFHAKYQTYIGIAICDEWRNFCAFRTWWIDRHVDGWQLDKDVLSGSRIYSLETCLFVPQWLNSFTTDSGAARGEWPIGVCFNKQSGRFMARCRHPFNNESDYLGLFNTPEEAHLAWRARKLELALELKPKMDEIDLRIYPRVIEIINNAK